MPRIFTIPMSLAAISILPITLGGVLGIQWLAGTGVVMFAVGMATTMLAVLWEFSE